MKISFGDVPLILRPGDTITDCTGVRNASDRIMQELATCHFCGRPTYRVITITSAAKLERRAALCGEHFSAAMQTFPQLKGDVGSGAA
jgi:hypothetical protein